jgi:hypothetical protein
MNLRQVANRYTRAVNPNLSATLQRCSGYTTSADGRRVPSYGADEDVNVQLQTLTQSELEHLDKLNISNGQASVFIDTQLSSVDRSSQSGGDLIVFSSDWSVPASLRGQTWLVVALLEGWPGSGWCKAAITSQMA